MWRGICNRTQEVIKSLLLPLAIRKFPYSSDSRVWDRVREYEFESKEPFPVRNVLIKAISQAENH